MNPNEIPIHEIIPSVFVSQLTVAQNRKLLKKYGITHIVNLSQFPNYFPENFKYLTIDIPDSIDADISQHFEHSSNFIHDAIKKKGKVLIHCYAGLSRSPTICISYLVQKHNMPLDEAIKFYTSKRQHVINFGFMNQLARHFTKISNKIITRSALQSKYSY